MKQLYIAMHIDIIDNCIEDIDPEILGIFNSEEDAFKAISNDVEILCSGYNKNKKYWPIVKRGEMLVTAYDDCNEKHVTQYYINAITKND